MKIILLVLGIICINLPICMLFWDILVYPANSIMCYALGIGVGLVVADIILKNKSKRL